MKKEIENFTLLSLLIDPKYRIWRHLFFIITGALITSNLIFIAFQDCSSILGNRIYLICLSAFMLYLVTIYFNYFYLVPKLLLKGKYTLYLISLSVIVFSLPIFSIMQEYWVRNALNLPHRITSYTNPLILVDSLASFMITAICFCSISAGVLFRNWIARNKYVSLLEYEHSQTEVNKLKGQITPEFLSKTLNNASTLAKTVPAKASDALMRLGQLLRYQLYDCNREKVLLKSEINFLSNFLYLGQMNKSGFEYDIETEGNLNNVLVSPLLFISFIQDRINDSSYLKLTFYYKENALIFLCQSGRKEDANENELHSIKKRLELLYPGNYILSNDPGIIKLQINLSE